MADPTTLYQPYQRFATIINVLAAVASGFVWACSQRSWPACRTPAQLVEDIQQGLTLLASNPPPVP